MEAEVPDLNSSLQPRSPYERQWRPRLYRSGDEVALARLFGTVFGRPVSSDWWLWKFKSYRPTESNVWVAALDDGEIVGQYAAMPAEFIVGGRQHRVMVSVDTMTHPAYRRQGILTALAEPAYQDWKRNGYAAVLGVPNEQWGTRISALGWEPLFPLVWHERILNPSAVLLNRVSSQPLRVALNALAVRTASLTRRFAEQRLKRAEALGLKPLLSDLTEQSEQSILEMLASYGNAENTVNKNAAWLRWRFSALGGPFRAVLGYSSNRPIGYIVYKRVTNSASSDIMLADYCTDDERTARFLLNSIIADPQTRLAGRIRALAPAKSAGTQLLSKAGLRTREATFTLQAVPLQANLNLDEWRVSEHWHFTGCEFDIV